MSESEILWRQNLRHIARLQITLLGLDNITQTKYRALTWRTMKQLLTLERDWVDKFCNQDLSRWRWQQ